MTSCCSPPAGTAPCGFGAPPAHGDSAPTRRRASRSGPWSGAPSAITSSPAAPVARVSSGAWSAARRCEPSRQRAARRPQERHPGRRWRSLGLTPAAATPPSRQARASRSGTWLRRGPRGSSGAALGPAPWPSPRTGGSWSLAALTADWSSGTSQLAAAAWSCQAHTWVPCWRWASVGHLGRTRRAPCSSRAVWTAPCGCATCGLGSRVRFHRRLRSCRREPPAAGCRRLCGAASRRQTCCSWAAPEGLVSAGPVVVVHVSKDGAQGG
mmetsp:Transcript_86168/g.257180  ORF Transcript_86168/g.257180 Transcript_86168/m.257180 type:complete len:268 (-) Transcript_86168:161-964(-)